MKIKHYFGLAVIAAMTVSCSSNDELVNGGNGSGVNESGASYASFSISLPTTSGTRAIGNPEFNQGTDKEYDVNDVTLLIFKEAGSSEGAYTYVENVTLGSMAPWKDPHETGVTTHSKITAQLKNVNTTDQFYALVLLNNGSGTDKKVNLPSTGNTYSEWNAATNANSNFEKTDKGFYMANAPLFDNTNHKVTTLVPIKKENIYPTEAQASANAAAADIYVERGLAKITLGSSSGEEKTVADGTYATDKVKISNWALDVTNKKTFPIHNVDGLDTDYEDIWKNTTTASPTNGATNQRFVDNVPETKVKRVYWGIDPNYKNNALSNDDADGNTARSENFNIIINKGDVTAAPTDPLYCLENTFNLANMKQGQTTRVIFKAKYTPHGFTAADGNTFFKIGKNVELWKKSDLIQHIKAAVTNVITSATDANTTITLAGSDNDLTKAGNRTLKASNITVDGYTLQDADVTAINNKLGLSEGNGISTYENGESYYIARIKHFGDDLTKWESGDYGANNLAYLGRYGVLRNNWYELTVGKVSNPGYPDVPKVKPNSPDDEDDKYINVSVKILSWAKRSQTVDL